MHRLKPRLRIKHHLSYANVMSTIAVALALAGGTTAVAISASGKNSDVNRKGNIRAARVTSAKIADGAITATKLGAVELVQRNFPGGGTVSCPSGERLLSGGGQPSGVTSAYSSYPDGNGWTFTTTGGAASVTLFALCLKS